jgi:hypothetical protein
LPQDLSLKSILSLVLQVLGITVDRIKQKVAKHIGEKNVARIEKAWEILSTFMKEGIGGLWNMLKDYLVDLKETVIGEIKNWVITQIIQAAVLKIVSMFNPVSGLIAIVKTICNMIRFLIERASQIQALFQTVAGSVVPLAMGNFETVANKVEQTLARLLPVAIGFLASLLGIGGIANKIKKIIKKLQAKVDKAIDKMISKVANNIKRFFGRGKSRRSEPSDLIDEVKKVVATRTKQPFSSLTEAQQTVQQITTQYRPKGLKSLRLVEQKGKEGKAYNVVASASPDEDVGSVIISTSAVKPTPGNIRYAIDGQGRPRRAWGWLSKTEGKRSPTAQSRISQSLNRLMREFGLDIQFHAGHLIGRQFGGSGTEENLVPMEQVINLSWYKAFEGAVASQVEETQGNELLYADVRVVYPDDPFKSLMKPEAVSKLPKNTREKLASAFRRVPEAIAWTKLVRREVGGKEIELAVPPPFPARQKLPSLGRILGAGAVIGEKVRTGKELFS